MRRALCALARVAGSSSEAQQWVAYSYSSATTWSPLAAPVWHRSFSTASENGSASQPVSGSEVAPPPLDADADLLSVLSALALRRLHTESVQRRLYDPRTIAFLVGKGVGTAAEVTALLGRNRSMRNNLFPFEAVSASYETLERITSGAGPSRFRGRLMPLPVRIVQRYTNVLVHSPAALERRWTLLCAPARDDESLAGGRQSDQPGSSAPLDDAPLGGAGLSATQALRVMEHMPPVLSYSTNWLLARRAWLVRLGVPDVAATMAAFPSLLGLALHTLEDKRMLLEAYGLDARSVVAAMPTTLGLSRQHLEGKLEFACLVMGLPPEVLIRAPVYFGLSLARRTRPRFFLLQQLADSGVDSLEAANGAAAAWRPGVEPRGPFPAADGCAPGTWLRYSDEQFAARALLGTSAAGWDLARMRSHVATPAFAAYCDAREAELRAFHAARMRAGNTQQRAETRNA